MISERTLMSKLFFTSLLVCGGLGVSVAPVRAQDAPATPPAEAPATPPAEAPAPAAPASAGLTGHWHIVLDTPGGDRELDADLQLNGDQVTGKWAKSDVAGTFKDGTLTLNFPFTSEEVGATAPFKVSGKLDGDTMTGTWEFTEYNGTLKGTRTKADSGT
jgi:hypothetical protein